jgi:uncharacterized protein
VVRNIRPAKSDRGRRLLIGVVLVLFVLFVSARGIARFATDVLWFESLGYGKVFGTILFSRIFLGVVFGVIGALAVVVNLIAADRLAPRVVSSAPEDLFIVRYRELMNHRGMRLRLIAGGLFGVLTGLPMAARWNEWLLFRHGVSFGVPDPQFGKDIGFYVFKLPFESFVVDWLFATVLICLLITAAAHYLNGGIKLQVTGRRVTSQVKTHLSVLLALLAVLKAGGYWLARYNLMASTRGFVSGAGYTDVKAQLPAIQLLLLISLLAAVLLIVNVRQKGWRLPVIAVGLWLIVAIVAGQAYPSIVQRFTVNPNESNRESLYIKRNIIATRAALKLDNVELRDVAGSVPSAASTEADLVNLRAARLVDPAVVSDAFTLQKGNVTGNLGNFRFLTGTVEGKEVGPTGLDLNRFTLDGKVKQVVAGVRELNPGGGQKGWENTHLAYTHGIGYVVADATTADVDGKPVFLNDAALTPERPQVYVGEEMFDYAVARTTVKEVDGTATTSYEGTGGVSLASRYRRLLFALRYGETNLLVSGSITKDSRILYKRDIKERAHALAPFLSIGGDPYAVVSDGRLKWVLDGFTTTDRYPYSQIVPTDELSRNSSDLRGQRFNYIRDSVKIVIDAFDGQTSFYAMDADDPILKAYQRAFPSLFQSKSELPESIRATLRYPHDLMQIQSTAWGSYRLDEPGTFYKKEGAWDLSSAPRGEQEKSGTSGSTPATTLPLGVPQPAATKDGRMKPYFAYLQLPGDETPQFVSLRAFVPRSEKGERRELAAYMTAASDYGSYGRLRVYRVKAAVLPPGPKSVDLDTSKIFSEELTKLDQQGSRVLFSELQLVPLGDSIAWLRSWFLKSNESTDLARLNSVTVTVGESTYRGKTREEAIAAAFKGASAPAAPTGSGGAVTPPPPGATESVETLLADAARLRGEAQDALKRLSFDEYRAKMEAAYAKLAKATELATNKPVTVTPPVSAVATTTAPSITTTTVKA